MNATWQEDEDWWGEKMEIVVDTGACASALPSDWFLNYPLLPNRGRATFNAANGGTMHAEGRRLLKVKMEDGKNHTMNFTVLPVKRPLVSVAAMVARGGRLVFDREERGGSYFVDRDGAKFKMIEKNGVYILETWVQGFQRQAWL